ncbi:MAG: ATPase, partial [Bdellovibrio sp.]
MYPRNYKPLKNKSFFLFGPRGTGKTTWLKAHYSNAFFVDLLNAETYRILLGNPHRLESLIPAKTTTVVIDEVQKVPALLDEVHRLIESRRWIFILTGSSARKLRRGGVNLLAG